MKPAVRTPRVLACEICILAGGLSLRMGQNKARMRLMGRTLLGHVRELAGQTALPFRVIREDLVPRCGPMGGIYTALKTTRAEAVLFLACDMPFVPPGLLRKLVRRLKGPGAGFFVEHEEGLGFPFLLRAGALAQAERCLARQRFALQGLAKALQAVAVRPTRTEVPRLLNLNSLADIAQIPPSIALNADAPPRTTSRADTLRR